MRFLSNWPINIKHAVGAVEVSLVALYMRRLIHIPGCVHRICRGIYSIKILCRPTFSKLNINTLFTGLFEAVSAKLSALWSTKFHTGVKTYRFSMGRYLALFSLPPATHNPYSL